MIFFTRTTKVNVARARYIFESIDFRSSRLQHKNRDDLIRYVYAFSTFTLFFEIMLKIYILSFHIFFH